MALEFSSERWDDVRKNACSWWNGALGRPLLQIEMTGRDPGRPPAKLAFRNFAENYGPDALPEDIVDSWDYYLCGRRYLGDAFPHMMPQYGAGIVAAFLGAEVVPAPDTVWFHPPRPLTPKELHFEFDADNEWVRRIAAVYRAALERWRGQVLLPMTDLGGTLDILATFLNTQDLLVYLLTEAEEIERLVWEVHELFFRYFDYFNDILRPVNPGFSAWGRFYSDQPVYMLQSDFCFNIGPEHFEQFVLPELTAACQRLGRSFYHLDGVGQLPHLDALLSIVELDGIQWIPGAGETPRQEAWPDLHRRILESGKKMQLMSGTMADPIHGFETIVESTGNAEGIVLLWRNAPAEREEEILDFLRRWGAA